ncbi:MAG TPA: hypothetical protein VMV10_07135 [Pirellulales bacterium]|nr:hypothetical protein [Pirellulales bacterium]
MSKSRIRWTRQIEPSPEGTNGSARASGKWRRRLVKTFFALVILLPCGYGFVSKFWELIVICRGDMSGAFAIAPIVNYLLASAGFLLLLGWAAANGMFHDIERPKLTMLEHERWLDSHSRPAKPANRGFHGRRN